MWFIFLFFILLTPVRAQDSSVSATPNPPTPTPPLFTQYKNDYLYQYDKYQQSYLKYVDKKQVYTKYGSITTQKEKFDSALNAIDARNHTLKAYLTALRVKLDDYKSANPTVTEKNQIELSKWEAWFDEQFTVIPAINNEDDLIKWATDFQQKYISIQQAIYTALVQNEVNLHQSTLNLITSTATLVKNNPKIKPDSQQWLSSLTVKSDLVNTSFVKATALTSVPKYQPTTFSNFYPEAKIELSKARNYLTEISSDLKLIVAKFINQ